LLPSRDRQLGSSSLCVAPGPPPPRDDALGSTRADALGRRVTIGGVISAALRRAPAIGFEWSVVDGCLDLGDAADARFHTAWSQSLDAVDRRKRGGALAGVTGHVAESVVELLLADVGYHPVWHFTGPGRHGVDLLMLSPGAEHVLAIEVKGTLRARHVPRLSRRATLQMSAAWVDKRDNPGMAEWDLQSADVYGVVIAVNFADMAARAIVSDDFVGWRSVATLVDLVDLGGASAP
jgi:hypothetical protein